MFDPRKTGNFLSDSATFGVILAALIGLSLLSQMISSGAAPMILLGIAALYALWWLYKRFISKESPSDITKYRKALKKQKKNASSRTNRGGKGKVIYLENVKRK